MAPGRKTGGLIASPIEVGTNYGDLTVISEGPRISRARTAFCKCSCGSISMVMLRNLRNGNTTKCATHGRLKFLELGSVYGPLTIGNIVTRRSNQSKRTRYEVTCIACGVRFILRKDVIRSIGDGERLPKCCALKLKYEERVVHQARKIMAKANRLGAERFDSSLGTLLDTNFGPSGATEV